MLETSAPNCKWSRTVSIAGAFDLDAAEVEKAARVAENYQALTSIFPEDGEARVFVFFQQETAVEDGTAAQYALHNPVQVVQFLNHFAEQANEGRLSLDSGGSSGAPGAASIFARIGAATPPNLIT